MQRVRGGSRSQRRGARWLGEVCGQSVLAVCPASVDDVQCEDRDLLIVDLAEDAVISDAVAPLVGELAREGFAVSTWVLAAVEVLVYP